MTQEMADQYNVPFNLENSSNGHKRKLDRLIALILMLVQFSAPLPFIGRESWSAPPAKAVLYSPDTKVPRTGELALRRAIPANTNMKAIQVVVDCYIQLYAFLIIGLVSRPCRLCCQDSLEDISYLLRIPQRKPYGTMEGNVKKALKVDTTCLFSFFLSYTFFAFDKGKQLH